MTAAQAPACAQNPAYRPASLFLSGEFVSAPAAPVFHLPVLVSVRPGDRYRRRSCHLDATEPCVTYL